jgi:hypothetical protein
VEQAVDLYADTLAGAFNHATHVGLPEWTKHGVVRWLYKGKGGKDNPDNYRLTVLQPTLTKVLERVVDLHLRELTDVQYVSVSVFVCL